MNVRAVTYFLIHICVICVVVITVSSWTKISGFCPEFYCKRIHWTQDAGMCSARRLAIVTGANKGLGLAIVRGLCRQFDGDVLLTARRRDAGLEAVKKLRDEGLYAIFHQLDVTNPHSIDSLQDFVENTYQGIDVLVNNAGVDFRTAQLKTRTVINMETNFWGTLNVSNSLFPSLKVHARVVNVASISAKDSAGMCSDSVKERFKDTDITMEKVMALMSEFSNSVEDGTFRDKGWPKCPYGISKIGVILMTSVQQKVLHKDAREDIAVNACCPGDVATDMTGFQGDKTTDQGADTPLYLALLPPYINGPRGKFVVDRKLKRFP